MEAQSSNINGFTSNHHQSSTALSTSFDSPSKSKKKELGVWDAIILADSDKYKKEQIQKA